MTKSEEMQLRKINILNGFKEGRAYQEIAKALGLGRGVMYASVQDLLKSEKLQKVGFGKYEVRGDVKIIPLIGRAAAVSKPVIEAPAPAPVPEPAKEERDSEDIATDLLDKIGKLQPLLLLHRELFADIESITMQLIDRITSEKPRTLSEAQYAEYLEFLELRKQAELIVASRKR